MAIQIEDVTVTKRWKTVADCKWNGFRLMNIEDAHQSIDRLKYDLHEEKVEHRVKFRAKKAFGFYFVQARLR
jgi:hypothetical protein